MAHKDVFTQVIIDQDMVEGAHPFSSLLDSLKQNWKKGGKLSYVTSIIIPSRTFLNTELYRTNAWQ